MVWTDVASCDVIHQKKLKCSVRFHRVSRVFHGSTKYGISWVVPPPRMPVANEGLGWDPDPKNITILVLTLTGKRDNPRNIGIFSTQRMSPNISRKLHLLGEG